MAVIETSYVLLNHAAEKGVSEVPIKSIKPAYLRLSGLLDSVEMKLKDIFHASACIAG
jgi:hypothetical protein